MKTVVETVGASYETRKELKAKAKQLTDELIAMVGKENYETVTSNQNKISLASLVLEDIFDKLEETNDPHDVMKALIRSSIQNGIYYFDLEVDYKTGESIRDMIEEFITSLDNANTAILGDNLKPYMKIYDMRADLYTQSALIKLQMNSTYGR